jgi:NAD(P)-dependent dehydrogenase (short-subunit alcohol dehydrogenase family)
LVGFRAIRKKLVVFILAANYCCRLATQVAKKFEGTGRGPLVTRFGRFDTLVTNAGIFIGKPFTEYTEANYMGILAVNIIGFFYIPQLAVAEMEKAAATSCRSRRAWSTTRSPGIPRRSQR